MFVCYTNCPGIPNELPDMCETCESYRNDSSFGHHTFLAIDWNCRLSDGTCLWYCSKKCFEMSPVPTIDDNRWK